jgi:hypothetical protein
LKQFVRTRARPAAARSGLSVEAYGHGLRYGLKLKVSKTPMILICLGGQTFRASVRGMSQRSFDRDIKF